MRINLGVSLNSITIFLMFKLVPISFAFIYSIVFIVFVQLLSHILFFGTPWTAAGQASLSFIISQRLLKLMSFESIIPSNRLILCPCFSSCPQSFPDSGSFPLSQLFTSTVGLGQMPGVSIPSICAGTRERTTQGC